MLRIVEREYDPVPVKKQEHDRIFKILGGIQATGGLNLKEMITIPGGYPAYLMFIVDRDGRILVRTFERGKADKEYFFDLFDSQGRYVHRFASRTDFVLWRNGRLFGTEDRRRRIRDPQVFPGRRLGNRSQPAARAALMSSSRFLFSSELAALEAQEEQECFFHPAISFTASLATSIRPRPHSTDFVIINTSDAFSLTSGAP